MGENRGERIEQGRPPTRTSSERTVTAIPLGFSQHSNAAGSIQKLKMSSEAAWELGSTPPKLQTRNGPSIPAHECGGFAGRFDKLKVRTHFERFLS